MGPGGTALVIISSNDAKTEKFTISEIPHVASVCVRPRKNTGFIKKLHTKLKKVQLVNFNFTSTTLGKVFIQG